MNWRGMPTSWEGFATARFSTTGSTADNRACWRNRFAVQSRPRSPRLWLPGQDDATQRLNDAMRTPRYQHLMQLLRSWKMAPPLTDAADDKGKTATKYESGEAKGRQATPKRGGRYRSAAPGA